MPSLEIQDLTKRCRGADVVDHVSFSIAAGEVTGPVGSRLECV